MHMAVIKGRGQGQAGDTVEGSSSSNVSHRGAGAQDGPLPRHREGPGDQGARDGDVDDALGRVRGHSRAGHAVERCRRDVHRLRLARLQDLPGGTWVQIRVRVLQIELRSPSSAQLSGLEVADLEADICASSSLRRAGFMYLNG